MKEKQANKKKKGNFFSRNYDPITPKWVITRVVSCIFIAALIVGINIGTKIANSYSSQLTAYLCPPITDDSKVSQAQAAGAELAKKVELEGAALLKNADNVLPLSKTDDKKVNVFGYGSVDWAYGAIGNGTSGQVRPEDDNINSVTDLMKALNRYGISTNTEIQDFYRNWETPVNLIDNPNNIDRKVARTLKEPPLSKYSEDLLTRAKEFSNTAIAVISRTCCESGDALDVQYKAGEGMNDDNSRHYLEISTEEEEMLKYLGTNFEKVIVLINAGNVMELGFMDAIPGLDACVFVGLTGTQAAASIPSLLWGDTAFSGKLADTIPYSFDDHPASFGKWFDTYSYSSGGYGLDYVEGIYVGYKWFETAAYEGVYTNVDKSATYGENAKGYYGVVQYPFGYGLSYTTFDWKIVSNEPEENSEITRDNKFKINVEVTNTGSYSGKDVVEAYVTVPYTKGGIEKSYVSLVGYAKTETLAPNTSQVVTVEVDANDFLSYDCYDKNNNEFKGYELEKGDYQIKLMTDSHNVKKIGSEEAIITYKVSETIKYDTNKYTGATVKNLFTGDDAVDGFSLDGIEPAADYNANIPFMSRNDFNSSYEIPIPTDAVVKRALSTKANAALTYTADKAKAWDNATGVDTFGDEIPTTNPTWGATKKDELQIGLNGVPTELGLELGKNYDDPRWEEVLDQVTFAEAINLISKSPSGNKAISSIGKPRLLCYDSMVQIKGFSGKPRGTGNPSTTILAMSFNKNLAYEYATNFANEMNAISVQGVFGPGVNIHRSPFGGRNWEYFSEDTYLTSVLGCTMTRGLQNYGCNVEMKHFALNEKENGRYGCSTWLSEQALREIYLKPFTKAAEEENLSGIMTAYNSVGSLWAGGSQGLITGILRKECGFKGYVDTDWTVGIKGTPDEQLRAGGEIGMAEALANCATLVGYDYSTNSSARLQHRIRNAVKNVLYGSWLAPKYQASVYVPSEGEVVNTSFVIQSWQWWEPALVALNCLVYFGCAMWLVALFFPSKKKKKKQLVATDNNAKTEETSNKEVTKEEAAKVTPEIEEEKQGPLVIIRKNNVTKNNPSVVIKKNADDKYSNKSKKGNA